MKRALVHGMMGQAPFAGMAWQVLHYVEGLRRLGFEVFYVEDTGAWPYDPEQNAITADCQYAAAYIAKVLGWCGLGDHWAYRSPAQDSATFGLSISQLARLYNGADVLVNLTGATVLRDEQLKVPVRIYLETDPVLPQIETAQGRQFTIDLLSAHTHHFTFGENLGASDCKVPLGRFTYQSTRQPVVLDWWELPDISSPELMANGRFTTIANWKQTSKDVEWDGQIYKWSKHEEFLKFIALPQRTTQPLELALASNDHEAMRRLQEYGWHLRDALVLSRELLPYRAYIGQSRGEFTVAKDQYVRLRSGWFSDRSACYLAAGRPVITQETGFSKFFPTGKGLFAFQTMEDILAAVDAINSDCQGNCRAAREIAAEYFTAEKVLGSLMERAGC